MKCPMTRRMYGFMEDCVKEECAWWHDGGKSCAVLQLSKDLYRIEDFVYMEHRN